MANPVLEGTANESNGWASDSEQPVLLHQYRSDEQAVFPHNRVTIFPSAPAGNPQPGHFFAHSGKPLGKRVAAGL
ncbi:MAG: hypothetical protein DYG96_12700 [Chlorobi bacterium CHB2]|nr:hypothetical protein [Chlorobi bacterium CHB2]